MCMWNPKKEKNYAQVGLANWNVYDWLTDSPSQKVVAVNVCVVLYCACLTHTILSLHPFGLLSITLNLRALSLHTATMWWWWFVGRQERHTRERLIPYLQFDRERAGAIKLSDSQVVHTHTWIVSLTRYFMSLPHRQNATTSVWQTEKSNGRTTTTTATTNHCWERLRHKSVVRVCVLAKWFRAWSNENGRGGRENRIKEKPDQNDGNDNEEKKRISFMPFYHGRLSSDIYREEGEREDTSARAQGEREKDLVVDRL